MAVNRDDYPSNEVNAAKSVLIELTHLLAEYKDGIVLVGGWVPEILIHEPDQPHIGSIDVDLALDHRVIGDAGYKSILKLLTERGYQQSDKQPFTFYRDINNQMNIKVQVDFLTGEYGGTGRGHRTQKVQDIQPRKARGCELAFIYNVEIIIEGKIPSGAHDKVELKVVSVPAFLAMKGIAVATRLKEKDSWDIYYCIRNYPKDIDGLVQDFSLLLSHSLVQEGLRNIAKAFSRIDGVGPVSVADFEGISSGEDRDLLLRDAYERVNALLELLNIRTKE